MLLPRFLTTVVGSAILLAALYFGGLPFFFVILGVVLLGVREFYFLAQETGYPCYPWLGLAASGVVFLSMFLNGVGLGHHGENQATSALWAIVLAAVVVRSLAKGPADTSLSEWSVTLFGVVYVAWTLGHLVLLRDLRPYGREAAFFLTTLIWTADTAAYGVGVRWGRRRIAAAVSPKKTWEGSIAGILAAMFVGVLFQMTFLRQVLRLPEALALSGALGVLGLISDLGESVLKRGAGVKDSSQLLPGHGGILDRFDSFILTAPFFYYYWAFLKLG